MKEFTKTIVRMVLPANAGTQILFSGIRLPIKPSDMDSRFRGNDSAEFHGLNRRLSKLRFLLRSTPIILLATFAASCYSFTGASIPPWIHTVGIPLVEDNSGFGQSAIRQDLTNQLIQKFTTDGSLQVANRSVSDALLQVTIPPVGIMDEPVSVRAGEIVTTKRLTMNVHAIYRDQKKQKLFWERDFSEFSDYPISGGLAAQQQAILTDEQNLSQDILIAAISNW